MVFKQKGEIKNMPMSDMLKKLRGDATQETVARAVGVTKSAWAMYERGERVPRDEVKIKIAEYFNRTVQEIFFGQ
nr:MAG TPA: helix-turn-helix domain protein [Caudoviricetes sp.]